MGMIDGIGVKSGKVVQIRAETIKKVLAGLAIDFIEGGAIERAVYLYPHELEADDIDPLPEDKCIKVTFTYSHIPN